MRDLISPGELRRLARQVEEKGVPGSLDVQRNKEVEKERLHDAFFQRDIHPDAPRRVSEVARRAAEAGHREILILTFPSTWTTDRGRRIGAGENDWPQSLEGFAKRAYDFFASDLEPAGYTLRAEVLNFPGGTPGEIGLYLGW